MVSYYLYKRGLTRAQIAKAWSNLRPKNQAEQHLFVSLVIRGRIEKCEWTLVPLTPIAKSIFLISSPLVPTSSNVWWVKN